MPYGSAHSGHFITNFFHDPDKSSNRRTVADALTNHGWVQDIRGVATVEVIMDFLHLWDLVTEMALRSGVSDKHIWRLNSSGHYSAWSAYEALFQGSILFSPWEQIWKTWAPNKCRLLLWLVSHDRCWTADHLKRRHLPHPESCPFCDQEDETIDHLLTGCVFAHQFWFTVLQRFGLAALAPQPVDNLFETWWSRIAAMVSGTTQQGLNSVIILEPGCFGSIGMIVFSTR
ncbi:hypothetical protein PR202_ga12428 [Eleusine coracana subsp. coracana]|uniref:Reverse transcriptase zinc-binding domain-containing protein n=1 Tax=Eleusine coracana subsp. coracana TaxID=191504 RepID=A0AAV5CC20_ELECO|nr:hypothetical protein PR202_ga12428 [Eleusine coracana subsp. coracana]